MMEAFHAHFPQVASREIRTVTLMRRYAGLPAGEYTFFELYCMEPGCDCDNVMFNVVERTRGHLATLNHGLSKDSFADVGMPRTFLDRLNKQSRYSQALLKLFLGSVLDDAYSQRLRRHLDMIKAKVGRTPRKKPGPMDHVRHLMRWLKQGGAVSQGPE